MEPNGGHIQLHRRIREHAYWADPERLRAWIDILLMASWKPHERLVGTTQVHLERGEFPASERFLAARWHWSRGKVRRFLKAATAANEIRPIRQTGDGAIYAVVNYDVYQFAGPGTGPQTGPPSDHQMGPPSDQREEGEEGKERRRGRSTALGPTWKPNDTHRRIAAEVGVDVDAEAVRFRDHAASTDRRLVDWDAGFRNWLRSPHRRAQRGTGRGGRPNGGRPPAEATALDQQRQRDAEVRAMVERRIVWMKEHPRGAAEIRAAAEREVTVRGPTRRVLLNLAIARLVDARLRAERGPA